MTKRSVAVIGSRGFVGSNLVKYLQNRDWDVAEYSSKLGNFVNTNERSLVADFDLPDDCQCVIYLAQSPNYRKLPESYEELALVNSILPFSVAKKAIQKNIPKFLYFSTGSVYLPSGSPLSEDSPLNRDNGYALSKIHGEENLNLLQNQINICNVRPFHMFGEGQREMLVFNLAKSILENRPVTLDSMVNEDMKEGLKISVMHVEDVVSTVESLITQKLPSVMNFAGERSFSVKEICELISEGVNKRPEYLFKDQPRPGNLIADITALKNIPIQHKKPDVESQIIKFAKSII